MKKIIINADDFGYSKVFNESILFLLEDNKIDSVSIMIDYIQDNQKEQIKKIKKYPNRLGLHVDFENIDLKKTSFYSEIERQYKKFIEIFDFEPVFLDMHKYSYREEGQKSIKEFSIKNNIFYRNLDGDKNKLTTTHKKITGSFKTFEEIKELVSKLDDGSVTILFHPGKFDKNSKSSFNKDREKDVENIILLNDFIDKNRDGFQKISYLDLK